MNVLTLLSVPRGRFWVAIFGAFGSSGWSSWDRYPLRCGLRLLLLEDPESLKVDKRRRPNCWNILSCFLRSSCMRLVMKTPRITITDAMVSEIHDSTTAQYIAHTGAVPLPVFVVSVNEPMSRISAQMIITNERHNMAASDSFRENGIIDLLRTTIGTLTTKGRSALNFKLHFIETYHILSTSHTISRTATITFPARLRSC